MRAINQPPTDDEFLLAIEMRSGGKAWKHVGEALNRAEDTVRKWPKRYPERWAKMYDDAELRAAQDGAAEALYRLRLDLRGEDGEAGRQAAKVILAYRIRLEKLRHRANHETITLKLDNVVNQLADTRRDGDG